MNTDLFGEPMDGDHDADALQDGELIDVTDLGVHFGGRPINRCTRSVWFDWRDEFQSVGLTLPRNALPHHLRAKLQAALRAAVYQGGRWTLPERLWLRENEVAGWSLMRPEDQ